MVEIGASTLLGIAVTIFFSILGIGVSFLYRISVNLRGIEESIDRMNENLGGKLDRIDENTGESAKLLHRIAERTRNSQGGFQQEEDKGNEDAGTDGGTDLSSGREGEIIDSDSQSGTENTGPGPDTEHIRDEPSGKWSDGTEWEYGFHVLDRIEEMDEFTVKEPDTLHDMGVKNIANHERENVASDDSMDQHWVTEEAEDISFALSREIGESELYLSVAVGEGATQVNYHIAQAGFPGLVGADPKQNKITQKILDAAEERYGDNAVLSVHSGQVVVSIPKTELESIKDWIEDSTKIIEDIIEADSTNQGSNQQSRKK